MGAIVAGLLAAAMFAMELWRYRRDRAKAALVDDAEPMSWKRPVDVLLIVATGVALFVGGLFIAAARSVS